MIETRVCRLYGQLDVRIETEQVPEPQAGEVRLAMGAGGICGSDLHYFLEGGFGPIRVKEPIILGHEVAGVVEAIGSGVEGLAIGNKVAVNPSRPCGECTYCQAEMERHCLSMRFFGSALRFPHEQGAFRDRMLAPATQCEKLAEGITLAEGACAEPLAVALHAANRAGNLQGKRVLVTGTGPIGALCIAAIRHAGAKEIVVTDLQDATLAIAKQMGADKTINMTRTPDGLDAYFAEKGYFDCVFECSAAAPALRAAIAAVRPMGTIVQVGVTGDLPIPINVMVGKEITYLGTHRFSSEYAEAVRLINAGQIDVKPIITGSYTLDRVLEAFDAAKDRSRSSKVQLQFVGHA